jgi:hypothetical protein
MRALYKLAAELRDRGKEVAIYPLASNLLGLPGFVADSETYGFLPAWAYSDRAVAGAIHIYPEIVQGNPAGASRVVRWFLNTQIHPVFGGELVYAWKPDLDPSLPLLTVDVIEPALFYPKTEPGNDVLLYQGKGSQAPRMMSDYRPVRLINHEWPADRSDLADELRKANLLVTSDGYSMLNIEAVQCGTPVLLANGAQCRELRFGSYGITTDPSRIEQARAECGLAQARYQHFRENAHEDIDRLLADCLEQWG